MENDGARFILHFSFCIRFVDTYYHSPLTAFIPFHNMIHRSFIAVLLFAASAVAADEPITPEQKDFFEKKIAPVFAKHCYACHSAEAVKANKLKGGLLLDSRE